MSYCTQTDLEKAIPAYRLVELTVDDGSATADVDKIARAITNADSVIDAHVRAHYSVPLSPVPALILKLSVDLALYELFGLRGPDYDMPKWMQTRYDAAVQMLEAIEEGKRNLGIEPPPAESAAVIAEADGPDRLFTAETLVDY